MKTGSALGKEDMIRAPNLELGATEKTGIQQPTFHALLKKKGYPCGSGENINNEKIPGGQVQCRQILVPRDLPAHVIMSPLGLRLLISDEFSSAGEERRCGKSRQSDPGPDCPEWFK